jgi:uncharacterized protein YaiE (UPF0345 family)
MVRKQKMRNESSFRMTRLRIIMIGVLATIVCGVGIFSYKSMIPVNGTTPVFGAPANLFIKATHSGSGYHWLSMASGTVKGTRSSAGNVVNPEYTFSIGELETFHVINEDYTTKSDHNFNIDAFNVHTKDLRYYEGQAITFIADKSGTFEYYCTIHPEMKGEITVG